MRKFYRNLEQIDFVDPFALFELINDRYVLIDDDRYLFIFKEGNENMFIPVELSSDEIALLK